MASIQFPQSTKGWRYGLRESAWITASWNWLSTLICRGAEPILLACIVYSVISITPDIPHFSSAISGIVAIIQVVTQDVAGIGLMKLATRANLDKESEPYKLGQRLVWLMVASLILAIAKNMFKVSDSEPWLLGVEGILSIIRAVMAVQYGPKIHELNAIVEGHEANLASRTQTQDQLTVLLKQASTQIESLQNAFNLKLQTLQNDLQNTFTERQNESLKTLSTHLQSAFSETLSTQVEGLQNTFNLKISAITEGQVEGEVEAKLKVFEGRLEGLSTLSMLPELKVKIEQLEGQVEGELKVKTEGDSGKVEGRVEGDFEGETKASKEAVTQPLERVRKPATPTSKDLQLKLQPEPIKAPSVSADQKKDFIFNCLIEDPNMTIVEIKKRALEALSITLSDGSISGYRKTFNEAKLKVS